MKKETYFAKCEATKEHYTFRASNIEEATDFVKRTFVATLNNVWNIGPISLPLGQGVFINPSLSN